jgi:hypothetical protein
MATTTKRRRISLAAALLADEEVAPRGRAKSRIRR